MTLSGLEPPTHVTTFSATMHSLETVGAEATGMSIIHTLWEAASFSAAAYGDPRLPGSGLKPPHLRLNIKENAMDVLDVAVPVLIAVDVRNSELPLLLLPCCSYGAISCHVPAAHALS